MSASDSGGTTAFERVLESLAFREGDRVPFFLLLTAHGARELGMPIREYFRDPHAIAEGQIRMQRRYGHDCLVAFTYAGIETEAWGGEIVYSEDGPPNAGAPLATSGTEIDRLEPPAIQDCECLSRILEATALMRQSVGDRLPIVGVVMSPFSVPIMQLGFQTYLELIYYDRERFWGLMAKNEEFCRSWANAQLEAGASAICYFDPVSSTEILPRELYLETGWQIARRTIAGIKGPTATHFASGRSLFLVDEVAQTGTAIIGMSVRDDLAEAKRLCAGKLTVLGNLNGVAMRRWKMEDAEREVKAAIKAAARGGGFILSDNHGEIPWSVPETVLDAISEAVHTWGRYPLDWID